MFNTTLCYVLRGDEVLMLHRVKKKNDVNQDKWIGIGGKFELLLVRAPKNLAEIGECLQALQTQKYNCAMITFLSTDSLTVVANPDMPWTLDGEREDGHAHIEIQNLHQALRLMKKE